MRTHSYVPPRAESVDAEADAAVGRTTLRGTTIGRIRTSLALPRSQLPSRRRSQDDLYSTTSRTMGFVSAIIF